MFVFLKKIFSQFYLTKKIKKKENKKKEIQFSPARKLLFIFLFHFHFSFFAFFPLARFARFFRSLSLTRLCFALIIILLHDNFPLNLLFVARFARLFLFFFNVGYFRLSLYFIFFDFLYLFFSI